MQKYRLSGLDCAHCAAKLEEGLKQVDGVRSVSLNFATSTLLIDADEIEAVEAKARQLEPDVVLTPASQQTPESPDDTSDFSVRRELILIGIAAIAFIAGLIARPALQQTPYGFGEYAVFMFAYFLSGWDVLLSAGRNVSRGKPFDENFLMSIATFGAIALHELPEAVGVMLFFKIGEFLQDLSVSRSRRSIQSLLKIRPDYANLQRDGALTKVSPEDVQVGDTVVVKPGEKIPLDGEVIAGSSQVDTSALTGEPIPRHAAKADMVLAGMINKTGALTLRVTRRFEDSSVARILDLVENASSRKARPERFITKFARYYTPAVVFGALAVAALPPLITGASTSTWFYRALILLVISCPCALVISIPLSYFGGIGGASRKGILIKGSSFLDVLNSVKTVVYDKTGTLTQGKFRVSQAVSYNGFSNDELLRFAASAESQSNHPIAQSIQDAYSQPVDPSQVEDYKEFSGLGVRSRVSQQMVLAGNDALLHHEGIEHEESICDLEGTVVHLAVDGNYAGHITIEDALRDDAPRAVQALRQLGIEQVLMLTGDRRATAQKIADKLGLDSYHAELLPEDKVTAVEKLMHGRSDKHKVAFVGDGINDAPVIARADVGIAMGGIGSDAAIDTADVVIMTDSPAKVAQAIEIGRKTRRIVWQNIVLALGVKGGVIVLGVIGIATMWTAVFADVGVALLAVANATRMLKA